MSRSLHFTAFFLGLAALCWVAIGYVGVSPLALVMTLIIGGFYVMGGLELYRFDQGTSTLARAVAGTSEAPASLAAWLVQLPASLQNSVRLRVEGERGGPPGPT